jgi:hypothetical protein
MSYIARCMLLVTRLIFSSRVRHLRDTHICWKVDREDRIDPPIQTEYWLSGRAMTLIFIERPVIVLQALVAQHRPTPALQQWPTAALRSRATPSSRVPTSAASFRVRTRPLPPTSACTAPGPCTACAAYPRPRFLASSPIASALLAHPCLEATARMLSPLP